MPRALVVIRHLSGYAPVFHNLVQSVSGLDKVTEEAMMNEAKADVERFQARFTEFKDAVFYYQWLENMDDYMTVLHVEAGSGHTVIRPKR